MIVCLVVILLLTKMANQSLRQSRMLSYIAEFTTDLSHISGTNITIRWRINMCWFRFSYKTRRRKESIQQFIRDNQPSIIIKWSATKSLAGCVRLSQPIFNLVHSLSLRVIWPFFWLNLPFDQYQVVIFGKCLLGGLRMIIENLCRIGRL